MTTLFTELQRVASAPYAVSLKPLLDALNSPPAISTFTITLFTISHPCLLPQLASALLTALEYCPFAERVLEKLAKERNIRDAILLTKRAFLDGMLRSAMTSDRHFHRYSPIVLSLLHNPLPSTSLPPPATIGSFFLRCVEAATISPTHSSIHNIYTLVSTSTLPMAPFLSKENYTMLLSQLTKFLRNTQQGCVLASLASLAIFHTQASQHNDQGVEIDATIAHEFFSLKKSEKVLGLVCFNVITAITGSGVGPGGTAEVGAEMSWEERLDQVAYADVIVHAISNEAKERYIDGEGKRGRVLENLMGKMKRLTDGPGDSDAVMEESEEQKQVDDVKAKDKLVRGVVKFIVGLAPAGKLGMVEKSSGLLEFVEKIVKKGMETEDKGVGTGTEMGLGIDGKSLAEVLASYPTSPILSTLLRTSFILSTTPLLLSPESFPTLQDRIFLISSTTARIPTSPSLRKSILSSLCTNEFSAPFKAFLTSPPPIPNKSDCTQNSACPFALAKLQRELRSAICSLLLTCGMYNEGLEEIERLSPRTAAAVLDVLKYLNNPSSSSTTPGLHCPYEFLAQQSISQPLTILETSATPGTTLSSNDWRARLAAELTREATRQHTGIISSMGEICRDLERRCEGIEKPLRDEQARSLSLSKEIKETKDRAKQLEDAVDRKTSEIKHLERDRERLERQVDSFFEKVHEAEAELQQIRDEYELEQKRRREDAVKAKEERESIEGEHLGELAERGAKIASLESKLGEFEGNFRDITDELRRTKEELEKEQREANRFSADLAKKHAELEEKQKELEEKDREISEVEKDLEDVSDNLQQALLDIKKKDSQVEELTRSIIELKERVAEVINDRDKVVEEKNGELAKLTMAMTEMRTEAESREQDVQGLEETITSLTAAIDVLKAEKDRLLIEVDKLNEEKLKAIEALERDKEEELEKLQEKMKKDLVRVELEKAAEIDRVRGEEQTQRERIIMENSNAVSHLKNTHDKALLGVQAQLQKTRQDWITEREKLFSKNRALEKMFESHQRMQALKEKEFNEVQSLAQKLMATMGVVNQLQQQHSIIDIQTQVQKSPSPFSSPSPLHSPTSTPPPSSSPSTAAAGAEKDKPLVGSPRSNSRGKRKSTIQVPASAPTTSTSGKHQQRTIRRKLVGMMSKGGNGYQAEEGDDDDEYREDEEDEEEDVGIVPESFESHVGVLQDRDVDPPITEPVAKRARKSNIPPATTSTGMLPRKTGMMGPVVNKPFIPPQQQQLLQQQQTPYIVHNKKEGKSTSTNTRNHNHGNQRPYPSPYPYPRPSHHHQHNPRSLQRPRHTSTTTTHATQAAAAAAQGKENVLPPTHHLHPNLLSKAEIGSGGVGVIPRKRNGREVGGLPGNVGGKKYSGVGGGFGHVGGDIDIEEASTEEDEPEVFDDNSDDYHSNDENHHHYIDPQVLLKIKMGARGQEEGEGHEEQGRGGAEHEDEDAETEYAFGESVEFTSTPLVANPKIVAGDVGRGVGGKTTTTGTTTSLPGITTAAGILQLQLGATTGRAGAGGGVGGGAGGGREKLLVQRQINDSDITMDE